MKNSPPTSANEHFKAVPYDTLKTTFNSQELFTNQTWLYSPTYWKFSKEELVQIKKIGHACYEFYHATERLYRASKKGKNLLRNDELHTPWVCDYLERGKPDKLIEFSLDGRFKKYIPTVIRPDLILTDEGFALTELDSVPGGIGLTAFLYTLYGEDKDASRKMVLAFHQALQSLTPKIDNPTIAIAISEESETYRPEMQWLASQLSSLGKNVHCLNPESLSYDGQNLVANLESGTKKVDILYRFFELFDLDNIAPIAPIMQAARDGAVVITPPMKTFQEEKLNLALFHHPYLEDYWREALTPDSFEVLHKIVPKTWILDPTPIPPNATLNGPLSEGKPLKSWTDLIKLSQKERDFIIKISGYHESAWGARSVTLGSDKSSDDWADAIHSALESAHTHFYILQEYKKPKLLTHPLYNEAGETKDAKGRLRVSPYYFVHEKTPHLSGILATFCPPDKKIIHGMKDAALLPGNT